MLVSSLQGAEIAQTTTKASDSAQTVAASSTTQAYYFSPALVIDPKSGTDVLEYRNTSTGAVINQYPSEKDIQAYTQNTAKPVVAVDSTVKSDTATAPAQSTALSTGAVQSTTAVVV